jgi:hypothetical protein
VPLGEIRSRVSRVLCASGGVRITSHPLASRLLITFVPALIPDALNTFDVPYENCTLSHMVVSENVRKLSKATSTSFRGRP